MNQLDDKDEFRECGTCFNWYNPSSCESCLATLNKTGQRYAEWKPP